MSCVVQGEATVAAGGPSPARPLGLAPDVAIGGEIPTLARARHAALEEVVAEDWGDRDVPAALAALGRDLALNGVPAARTWMTPEASSTSSSGAAL